MNIKWESLPWGRFRELYVDRLLEDNPRESFEQVNEWADSNEPASLCFGSTGYDFSPARLVDGTAMSVFLHGSCALFAHCFNEKNNNDKYLLISQKDSPFSDWSGHVLSALPDNSFFDVTGSRTLSELEEEYVTEQYDYEVVSEAVLWERNIFNRASYSHPSLWVDCLERAYVCAVVDEVSSRNRF